MCALPRRWKELGERLHRHEEPVGIVVDTLEAVRLVEAARRVALCIDDHAQRSDVCAALVAGSQAPEAVSGLVQHQQNAE